VLGRIVRGQIPSKPHTRHRDRANNLLWEECFTRQGFDGPYTILYRENRPHEQASLGPAEGFLLPDGVSGRALARRHYKTWETNSDGPSPRLARIPLLFNDDVVISVLRPFVDDDRYFSNADADDLYFILAGSGALVSPFGTLKFREGDYLCVPRGVLCRFELAPGEQQHWLSIECFGDLNIPARYRNSIGQLKMEAPYCHRDFRAPEFFGADDEELRGLTVKRQGRFHAFECLHSPLDVTGYDGTVYPFAFNILDFEPRVGQLHLPPSVHATFEVRGAIVCSFVPRLLDFHDKAVACPYPHSSVHIDEVLFYANGNFESRHGVQAGSLSHHPAGIPHGPHPGRYEASKGGASTEELAVMLDCSAPLRTTPQAVILEDAGYHDSFFA
jgi:homogentisate 1,2-dioxygenase